MLAGCDDGTRVLDAVQGPPLRVIATYPQDGAGLECQISDLECGVPIDVAFEIRFDRYLLPATAGRESFSLYSGDRTNPAIRDSRVPELTPRYDVVERVVTYELPRGIVLRTNTHYTAELVVPRTDESEGFRAFDGAPLEGATNLRVSFLTSNQTKVPISSAPPGSCTSAVAIFDAHCTSGGCHNAADQEMQMDLGSTNGLVETAVGRVAHEAETGTTTGVTLQNPARFGVGMPRIDPGRPDNSYLMYKLLISQENYRMSAADADFCQSEYPLLAVDPEACVPSTSEENERLRAWFLRGVGMPRAVGEELPRWLLRGELRNLDSFIRAGAACP